MSIGVNIWYVGLILEINIFNIIIYIKFFGYSIIWEFMGVGGGEWRILYCILLMDILFKYLKIFFVLVLYILK